MIWKVGQRVEYRLTDNTVECGVIEEVDDTNGRFADNPWIVIKLNNGKRSGTQKTLMKSGVKVTGEC